MYEEYLASNRAIICGMYGSWYDASKHTRLVNNVPCGWHAICAYSHPLSLLFTCSGLVRMISAHVMDSGSAQYKLKILRRPSTLFLLVAESPRLFFAFVFRADVLVAFMWKCSLRRERLLILVSELVNIQLHRKCLQFTKTRGQGLAGSYKT